jgi:hypothetical protein
MASISDLLFAFTEWLRTTPLVEFSLWISETKASMVIGTNFFFIPVLQTMHILAIAAAFSAVLMVNSRILGFNGRNRTVAQTTARYNNWIWWCLVVLVISGIGMIIGEPVRELINPIFWVKMGLIIVLILFTIWYQGSVGRKAARWDVVSDGRAAIRFGAIALILLWCAVMAGGRWIAYAPT